MTTTPVLAKCLSHVGLVRDDNQDTLRSFLPDDPLIGETHGSVLAIADGMGGYAKGGVASATAIEIFFTAFYQDQPAAHLPALRRAMEQANLAVHRASFRLNAGQMGITLTVADIAGDRLYLAHVGDTRAYLVRDGQARCLTNDHGVVGELVRMRVSRLIRSAPTSSARCSAGHWAPTYLSNRTSATLPSRQAMPSNCAVMGYGRLSKTTNLPTWRLVRRRSMSSASGRSIWPCNARPTTMLQSSSPELSKWARPCLPFRNPSPLGAGWPQSSIGCFEADGPSSRHRSGYHCHDVLADRRSFRSLPNSRFHGPGRRGQHLRAVDVTTRQEIAIKIPDPTMIGDPAQYERFQRQLEVMKTLRHPAIQHGLASGQFNRTPSWLPSW